MVFPTELGEDCGLDIDYVVACGTEKKVISLLNIERIRSLKKKL